VETWAGGVTQVVECLPGEHKALSQTPVLQKQKGYVETYYMNKVIY
jgi:hypothetical protein